MNNIKQEKVVNELLANGGSLANAMRKAGYSSKTARSPKKMTESKKYQEVVNPVIKAMEAERDAILKRLPKVRSKAKYRDLTDGLDKMTKNIQLLGGKPTENVSHSIADILDELDK